MNYLPRKPRRLVRAQLFRLIEFFSMSLLLSKNHEKTTREGEKKSGKGKINMKRIV